jgi:BirA family biotin operon repressor/biotin-[acetyl-CoA-carboxylase] ligase
VIIPERVREDLAASTRFRDIRLLDVTDSTNRVVSELAGAGSGEGIVVVADHQTSGRGRLERTWEDEPGSALLVSLLLRPAALPLERWHLVTAAVGLAAKDACARVAGVEAELKWPNDLLCCGDKLAGVLAETAAGGVVVGMGLNVHSAPPGAACLDQAAGRRVGRADLLEAWLRRLDVLLDRWDDVARRYRQECATVGRAVLVEQNGQVISGTAEGIDAGGRLLVRPDPGHLTGAGPGTVALSAGDVVHLRPQEGGAEGAW